MLIRVLRVVTRSGHPGSERSLTDGTPWHSAATPKSDNVRITTIQLRMPLAVSCLMTFCTLPTACFPLPFAERLARLATDTARPVSRAEGHLTDAARLRQRTELRRAPCGSTGRLPNSYLQKMAGYFAALRPPPVPRAVADVSAAVLARGRSIVSEGDAAHGVPACSRCHGPELTGMEPAIPGLVGLHARYISAQLGAFRLRHTDGGGAGLHAARRSQPDRCRRYRCRCLWGAGRQLFAIVLAILMLCPTAVPSAQPTERAPDTMEARLLACAACHGRQGEGTKNDYFPRLAGQLRLSGNDFSGYFGVRRLCTAPSWPRATAELAI